MQDWLLPHIPSDLKYDVLDVLIEISLTLVCGNLQPTREEDF